MKLAGVSALALLLAGCATAPTDRGFTALDDGASGAVSPADEDGAALLVFAIGPIGTAGGYWLQPVDAEALDFAGPPVSLDFAVWGAGDKMVRPKDDKSSIWILKDEINFLIQKVEPGTYAATYTTANTFNGVSSGTISLCQFGGAPTFEIKPGQINLILSRDAFPPGAATRLSTAHSAGDILAQFERTREAYPNLKGEPVIVPATYETRWTEKSAGFFGSPCTKAEEGSLSMNAIRTVTAEDAAPDDAEAAAIAEALNNLQTGSDAEEPAPLPSTSPSL
ncbi:MAG: hypothetical protein RLN72_05835 [Henriciella sp.]